MGDETTVHSPAPVNIRKKKDDKHRKRDPRSWENITRATANMSLEEKQQYLQNIYNELYNEHRTSTLSLQAREKQYAQCLKEHEKDRTDLAKSILARGQLESLCRELQKQNKLIKEENVARIKEEEDRRREVANTFSERLTALTNLITESKDKSNKVTEENQNMTQKLTELYEQYQQRESHLETVTRQLDLQKKLAETQAKKVEIEHEAERQTMNAQKRALEQYEMEMVLLQEKNRSLEAQVELYRSQYTDFETTMSKSNKVFDTFKSEMSKMSKQLHTLESERNDLRKRWQSSVTSLVVLSEQHMKLSNEHAALEKRLQMLQKLCRQLQEDRSAFLKQLKENNIEPIVPSLKNGENKENESEEHEADKSNESRTVKLKEELDKVKKGVKMSDSDSSTDMPRQPKRPRRVHFSCPTPPLEGVASGAGGDNQPDSDSSSSDEEIPLMQYAEARRIWNDEDYPNEDEGVNEEEEEEENVSTPRDLPEMEEGSEGSSVEVLAQAMDSPVSVGSTVSMEVISEETLAAVAAEVNLQDGPTPAQPAPDQPAPEQPAPDQPAPEQPAPDQPAPEQPAPDTPAPEQPAPDQPAPEQPAPQLPAAKLPVPEQPAPEQPDDQ